MSEQPLLFYNQESNPGQSTESANISFICALTRVIPEQAEREANGN